MKWLQIIRDWSEVWALLIPLIIILIYKPKGKDIRILVWYVGVGLFLNLTAMIMLEFYSIIPKWMYIKGMVNNNILYNIHSIARVIFFSWYILSIRQHRYPLAYKLILIAYLVFVPVNFILIESPFFLSTKLFAAESIVLLVFCLSYFIRSIRDDSQVNWLKHPSFLVCTGLSFYEAITFFIFLFFYPLSEKEETLGFFVLTMRIYSVAFIILCILLALAFNRSRDCRIATGSSPAADDIK